MENKNLFELATRNHFRFSFKGSISVEDLWDLSVEELDVIFKTLNKQSKETTEESLLDEKTKENKLLTAKIEIVKYIVKVKLEEDELRKAVKERKEKREKLLGILEDKQNEELKNKSLEDIRQMINELE